MAWQPKRLILPTADKSNLNGSYGFIYVYTLYSFSLLLSIQIHDNVFQTFINLASAAQEQGLLLSKRCPRTLQSEHATPVIAARYSLSFSPNNLLMLKPCIGSMQ